MGDEIKVGYFLEDRAHENILKSIVERIASEKAGLKISHDVRSARGGKSIQKYKEFLKFFQKSQTPYFDLLVVAIDGNCHRYTDRIQQLRAYAERARYPYLDAIVFAIPDPHIERWYLMDKKAFSLAVGISKEPDLPAYKCKKGLYKDAMRRAFKDAGIQPLLGGVEYGERIVEKMDLYEAGKVNAGFSQFVDDLRVHFQSIRTER